MKDCLFCKIIDGEIPSMKIYEDENALAFLDINYVNQGHTLVIPKQHSKNIFDIEKESLHKTIEVVKKVSKIIKESLNADGVNIHLNNESDAGQVIFHTHFHIIPRFKNDNIKMWEMKEYKEGEREKLFEEIKNSVIA